eukprot:scaffold21269_cov119-Isochrysis_galbana.AAC.2
MSVFGSHKERLAPSAVNDGFLSASGECAEIVEGGACSFEQVSSAKVCHGGQLPVSSVALFPKRSPAVYRLKTPTRKGGVMCKALACSGKARDIEHPFLLWETKRALRSMAKRKAAGPDKLPAEFYHSFENLILDRFHDMILEACAKGELPEGLTCGDIIVL